MSETIISPEIVIPKITIAISGSSINSVQACPTKDYLENVRLLRPHLSATVMDKGTLMHKVLEIYYKFKRESLPDPVSAGILAGRKLAISLDLPLGEAEEVITHFIQYVDYYKNDGWTPLFIEESFSVILYEDERFRILYEGTIDLVISNVQGIKLLVDHKTGSRNKLPLSLSNQFMGYAYSLDENNVVINKILFYKTEKEYKDKFRRYTMSYSARQLEEWKNNAIHWAFYRYELMNKKKENPDFILPMNLTSCDKYGQCIYTKVCTSVPGDSREYTISTEYKAIEVSHDEERFKEDE